MATPLQGDNLDTGNLPGVRPEDFDADPKTLIAEHLLVEGPGVLSFFGSRVALVTADVFALLQKELEATMGRGGGAIMYYAGVSSALRAEPMLRQMASAAKGMDFASQIALLNRAWAHLGFGQVRAEPSSSEVLKFSVQDSLIAKAYGRAERPVCYLYAGWASGLLRFLTGHEFDVEERQCIAAGATRCDFIATRAK